MLTWPGNSTVLPEEPWGPLTDEQSTLVKKFTPLARKLARRYRDTLGEDAVSVAYWHLCRAARDYDTSAGVKFITMAWVWITNGLRSESRNESKVWLGDQLMMDGQPLVDYQPDPHAQHERDVDERDEWEALTAGLTRKEKDLIYKRFWLGMFQREVAAEWGRSKERIRQIQVEAEKKILVNAEKIGLTRSGV